MVASAINLQASAEETTKTSTSSATIYEVSDDDLRSPSQENKLEIMATVHKVAVPPDLVAHTPDINRTRLGQTQYLFRLKISNLAAKPFYFDRLNAMIFLHGHPDATSVFRVNRNTAALLQPYDLQNFQPVDKQRIAGWKIDAGESLELIITSDGDPYAMMKLENDRALTLELTTQLNGVFLATSHTQLPLLENLKSEDPDQLGVGESVKFEDVKQNQTQERQ
jgi:hypothetical protein